MTFSHDGGANSASGTYYQGIMTVLSCDVIVLVMSCRAQGLLTAEQLC